MANVEIKAGETWKATLTPLGSDGNPGVTDGAGAAVVQAPANALGFNGDGSGLGFTFTNPGGPAQLVDVTFTGKAQDLTPISDTEVVQQDAPAINQARSYKVDWTKVS